MSLLPWGAAIRAAQQLGISPEAFWRLSLKEWRLLTQGASDEVLSRRAFERLCARHPDKTT